MEVTVDVNVVAADVVIVDDTVVVGDVFSQ